MSVSTSPFMTRNGLVEVVDRRQRADRPERLALAEVVDLAGRRRRRRRERLDQLGQVAGGDRDALGARRAQLAQHDVQDRAVPDGHQRLGQDRRVRTQAGARPHPPGQRRASAFPSSLPIVPPRVAVIMPCFNDGPLLLEAIASLDEAEPLEIVVVDDASTDPATLEVLDGLARGLARHPPCRQRRRRRRARMAGLAATTRALRVPARRRRPGGPGRARAAPPTGSTPSRRPPSCVGDYEEFGSDAIVRAVPDELDPFRVAYCNEYPVTALFRRTVLERGGGWRSPSCAATRTGTCG